MRNQMIKKIGIMFFILIMSSLLVYALTFTTNFNEGTYINTEYNGSAVILVGDNLTGDYTSKVFDAGNLSTWNNISWTANEPSIGSIYGVDNGGDIYYSDDFGVTWALKKENYGRTTDTMGMFSDSNSLYIFTATNKEIWKSTDNGANWNVVNNTFTTNGLKVGQAGSNNLYVIDALGTVFRSTDSGITWNNVGDFNGAATNDAKGIAINSSNGIFVVDGGGNVYLSLDLGETWTQQNDGYGGTIGTDGMVVDSSNNLYILLNSDVYQSTDEGITWTKINDDFSPYSNDGLVIGIEFNDDIYIYDVLGRVFKSINSGLSWNELGDLNSDANNDPKGFSTLVKNSNLDFQVRSCDDPNCNGESFIDIEDNSPQNLSVDDNRYFQYKVYFETESINYSPELYDVVIDYSGASMPPQCDPEHLQLCDNQQDCENAGGYWYNDFCNEEPQPQENQAPIVTLISPFNGVNTQTQQIIFSCSAIDTDGFEELKNMTLYGNWAGEWHANETKSLTGISNSTTFTKTLPYGDYVWNCLAYDNGSLSDFGDNNFTFTISEEGVEGFEEGSLIGEFSIAGEVSTEYPPEKELIQQIIIGIIVGSLFIGMLVLLVYLIFKSSK
jgi:photosystem II stability/assembly factor-like uncharacterized protein